MPKSRQRWVTSLSSSSKDFSSRRTSTRSRALSLPSRCWRARRSSPPPCSAAAWRRRNSSRRFIGFIVLGFAGRKREHPIQILTPRADKRIALAAGTAKRRLIPAASLHFRPRPWPSEYFPHFYHPLHFRSRYPLVGNQSHLPASPPPLKRTDQARIEPDRSHAIETRIRTETSCDTNTP